MKKRVIDFGRVRYGVLAACLAALIAWKGQPLLHGNSSALETIVTVFSILAGFLVAIITIVGDASALGVSSWRRDQVVVATFKRRLLRHKLMFQLYLIVLALVFLLQMFGGSAEFAVWHERLVLFAATFAFLGSLTLPTQLFQERLDSLQRKADAAVPPKLRNESK